MRLHPSDLTQATFPRAKVGGYKHEEVNDLLDRAAESLEGLMVENDELRGQVLRLRGELDGARGDERLLKEAILAAQRAAESLRADARREADAIREEARRQGQAERTEGQREAEALKDDVGRLQLLRSRLVAESRALVDRLTRELDGLDRPAPVSPSKPPNPEEPTQSYPTRLGAPKTLPPVEPIIVEDENGEKWVS